jgi:hypothetical protein
MKAMAKAPAPRPTRVEVAPGEAPKASAAPGARPGLVAVIVAHGVGRQVPFETVEMVAEIARRNETARGGAEQKIVTRIVRLERPPQSPDSPSPDAARVPISRASKPRELARAEVRVTDAEGLPRDVHFYEAYWAPFTEGRVAGRDVVSFLLAAGWNGLRNAEHGVFRRWMFQRWVDFTERPVRRIRHFATALLVVLSLIFINAVIGAVIASRVINGGGGNWPSAALLRWLTWDMTALTILAMLLVVAVIGLPAWMREPARPRHASLPPRVLQVAWAFVWTALLGTIVVAIVMAVHLVALRHAGWAEPPLPWWLDLLIATPWVISALASYGVRWFMVQYIGDVAAYCSAHTVSKFADVRAQICEASVHVFRAVYEAWDVQRGTFVYDTVIVVGHSLGSVIAYDTLNTLMLEDGFATSSIGVAQRTALFLTLGSPLDKTAFIFRTQTPHNSEVREGLAAAVQPMIVDYENRPRRWINIHSMHDWIGGSLEYYDDLTQEAYRARFVMNVEDPDATIPLVAHTMYWRNPTLAAALDQALMVPLPRERR